MEGMDHQWVVDEAQVALDENPELQGQSVVDLMVCLYGKDFIRELASILFELKPAVNAAKETAALRKASLALPGGRSHSDKLRQPNRSSGDRNSGKWRPLLPHDAVIFDSRQRSRSRQSGACKAVPTHPALAPNERGRQFKAVAMPTAKVEDFE